MKKKVLVVSLAVDQDRWVRFACECLVLLHAFQPSFQSGRLLRCFFLSDPAVTSYLWRRRKGKSLIRYIYVSGRLFVRTPPSKGAIIRPKANCVPSTIHGKKGMVSVKYTFVLISTVTRQSDTGTCF